MKLRGSAKPGDIPATGTVLPLLESPVQQQQRLRATDLPLAISLLGDIFVATGSLTLAYWLRFWSGLIPTLWPQSLYRPLAEYLPLIAFGIVLLLITFEGLELYRTRTLLNFSRVTQTILKGTTFWLVAYLGASLALKFDPPISRVYVVLAYGTLAGGLLGWRWLLHKALYSSSLTHKLRQRVIFVGWTTETTRLAEKLRTDQSQPYESVGWISCAEGKPGAPPDIPCLGDFKALDKLIRARSADLVVVADLDLGRQDVLNLANLCETEFVQFKVVPSYFQIFAAGLRLESMHGVPVLGVGELPLDLPINRVIKRLVDIVGSTVGLIISLPIMAAASLLIYRESPGPILYRQQRVGRNGHEFTMLKLRSMRPDAEEDGPQWAQPDDPRRLKIGAFMRRWNIDELPQFWNVLKGDMSLVGPRPERPELIAQFKHQIAHYNARHIAKSGMTGWAQVNGFRGNTSLEERVRCDVFYLENWSLWLDFQIMLMTFQTPDNAY